MQKMQATGKTVDQLVPEIAQLIITSVNLKNRNPDELGRDTSLTNGGLSLDSLDLLEIAVAVEQNYNVKITGPEQGREIFKTLGSLAEFVHSNNA